MDLRWCFRHCDRHDSGHAVLMGNTVALFFCARRHYRVPVLQLSSGQDFHGGYGFVIPWILFGDAVPAWFKQIAIVSFITPLIIIGVPLSDTFSLSFVVKSRRNRSSLRTRDICIIVCASLIQSPSVLIIYVIAAFSALAVIQSSVPCMKPTG